MPKSEGGHAEPVVSVFSLQHNQKELLKTVCLVWFKGDYRNHVSPVQILRFHADWIILDVYHAAYLFAPYVRISEPWELSGTLASYPVACRAPKNQKLRRAPILGAS